MRARSVALLCSLALFGAACASTDSGLSSVRSRPVDDSAPDRPDDSGPDDREPDDREPDDRDPDDRGPTTDGEVVDFGEGRRAQPYDDFLVAAAADIEAFWAEQYPIVYGSPFRPLEGGIYAIYPGRADDPTDCEGEEIDYDRVQGNAFYTDCGDLIAYDDAQLLPQLVDDLGEAAVGVVLAHEYGHAIQARAGVFDLGLLTVQTEQQADCFAGAWAAHVSRGESDVLSFSDTDVQGGLIAMIKVADPVGIDVNLDPNAHGTAFDRVGAFQEGFNQGAGRCRDFIDEPPPLINLTFTDVTDFENEGNLPYDDILTSIPPSLEKYWSELLADEGVSFTPPDVEPYPSDGPYPRCEGRSDADFVNNAFYCASTNTIVYDDDLALSLYDAFGDFSIGYLISNSYSEAVQLALQSSLQGEPRALFDDCLTGAWVVHIIPTPEGTQVDPAQPIRLSPGDLDEAVITAVELGDESADTNRIGSAFEKIDWFRAGVIGGLDACSQRLG